MRKAIMLLLLVLFAADLFGQQTTPPSNMTKADYLARAKNKKTAGWVLVSGGFIVTTVGLAVGVNEAGEDLAYAFTLQERPDNRSGGVLLAIGGATMLSSIPFFVAATRNKNLAAEAPVSMGLKMEVQPVNRQGMLVKTSYPAVSLRITL